MLARRARLFAVTQVEAITIFKELTELRQPAGSNRDLFDVRMTAAASGTATGDRFYSFQVLPNRHLEKPPDWEAVLAIAAERNLLVSPEAGAIVLSAVA